MMSILYDTLDITSLSYTNMNLWKTTSTYRNIHSHGKIDILFEYCAFEFYKTRYMISSMTDSRSTVILVLKNHGHHVRFKTSAGISTKCIFHKKIHITFILITLSSYMIITWMTLVEGEAEGELANRIIQTPF